MNCFECNRPAHGICKFCGRGVCKDHLQERVHVVSVFNNQKDGVKALVTKNALYCGKCKPVGDPVDLNENG